MRRLASTLLLGMLALGLASCAPEPARESCNDGKSSEFVIPAVF